ncbi:molybdopterin-guanine dinucleotide biosynthesis protein B [Poseidonibacter sp.]|jgi:molybdopterin-guanine dinucleotide biosynthesis protein B|uniref:molybdopterin-guanine dinucleotide biosynthesis protein B n=1 Tax=Poseidonibacter sp. TaxID=2321188 RepID=UPI003C7872E9
MKNIAVAFTGPSNSGKTTLIVELSKILQDNGYKVVIVKHDPKDKAMFDKEGKDSYKFSQTGADVAVVSPNKTTLLKQTTSSIENIVEMFGEFDYLLVEGLKTLPLPRIAIFRGNINEDYLEVTDILAIDDTIDKTNISKKYSCLDLNNYNQIIEWINKNGKKLRK